MQSLIEENCSKEWQEFINHFKKELSFKKDDFIFKKDEMVKGIYFINEGNVKILSHPNKKENKIIRLASDGDILGHRALYGNGIYQISSIALTDTKVCLIPIEVFNNLLKSIPQFSYAFSIFMAQELRKSEECLVQHNAQYRVVKAILENYNVFGVKDNKSKKLSYTLTYKDLANRAGTTYETLVRVISELKKSNIIKIENKEISILDLKSLKLQCSDS